VSTPMKHRLAAAWRMVIRGSIAPFNQIPRDGRGAKSAELDRPYEQSTWVMRAIKRVAEPIAGIELEFYEPGNDGALIEDPRLDKFWSAPVLGADGNRLPLSDTVEAIVGWLKLKGECFFIKTEGAFASVPFPEVVESFEPLVLATPGSMREIVRGGQLVAWRYTDDAGRTDILLPEQVVQIKFWNPHNRFRGMAEYEAARLAAESDRASGVFARTLAENNNDTAPIVSAKGGMLTPEQTKQIDAAIRERRELARQGIYKTLFVSGEVNVSDPTVRAPDAAFVQQRLHNRHEVAIAFGVPPSMFDVVASYSVGSASDRYLLIIETCQPLSKKIAGAFSRIASLQVGRPIEAWWNWDEHPVMQQVRRERIDSARKLWDMGMPLDEISEYLDMGLPEFEGSEQGYLPFSVAPVGESLEPATTPDKDPTFAEPEDDDQDERESAKGIAARISRALRLRSTEPHGADPALPCAHCDSPGEMVGHATRGRSSREIALWRAQMIDRKRSVKDYQAKIRGVLAVARKETLQKLEAGSATKAAVTRASASSFMPEQDGFRRSIMLRLRAAARAALQAAGEQVFTEVKRDDPWATPPEEVVQFLRDRENKLSGAADAMWERVRDEIQAGLDAGDPTTTIAARIKSTYNDLADDRALVVAQTEVAAAYGSGRNAAMKSAGVQWKKWLTSGNDNVRSAHAEANGQVVPFDQPFDVGGEALMHPGDPKGSAANVINCHCVSIAVASEDA
jgi:hypothetical protein